MNFHVANWYVDVDANRIHSDEQAIKLEAKVMTLLVYLANHQGDVISREQLEADVWSDRVISYDALTSCITRLRKVLGDNSRKPLFIETVSKKGYRLIAPVRWGDNKHTAVKTRSEKPVPEKKRPDETGRPGKNTHKLLFIVLLLLVITGITVFVSNQAGMESGSEIAATPSIVVLPFDNLSKQASEEYFSDGITADIGIALSKLSGLQVIATPSGQATTSEQFARYILTGSVQRANNKLRVNAILVDNRSQHQLWAEKYDREITDVFEVQDNITASIVAALSIKLTEEEKRRVAHRYTSNIDAYDQFLRGQALFTKHTSNENLLARQHFEQAIEIDPNFSRAYSSLALSHVDDYRYQWSANSAESLARAITLANKAVTIDSSLPQAHWALAYAQTHQHDYQQAIVSLEKALEIRPNYADGYAFLALISIYNGDAANGIKMIRRAMRLNPDYPAQYLSVLGQAYYTLQDYENARSTLNSAINKNFSLITAHTMLTVTLSQMNMKDEASWAADQLLTLSPGFKADDAARIFPVADKKYIQNIVSHLKLAGID